MNTAVDILAVSGTVQALAYCGAALVFGLKIIPQLRVAPPAKAPEPPAAGAAATAGELSERRTG